ncbi:MAG: hypothetical protein RL268_287 [Pseudomonadota bacterium]|jgi:hypothetical protein
MIVKGGPKGTRIINRSDFNPAIHELADAGRDPLDHDGSGKKGGSLPRRKKVAAHEG